MKFLHPIPTKCISCWKRSCRRTKQVWIVQATRLCWFQRFSKQLKKKKTFFSCQRKTCFFMLQWSGSTRTLTKSVSFVFQTTVFNRAQYHSQYGLSASFHQMKPNAVEPVEPLEYDIITLFFSKWVRHTHRTDHPGWASPCTSHKNRADPKHKAQC